MGFKPVKTKRIYEEIIDQVKGLIAEGALCPGDQLVPEREMADRLKVGRSAVREAFRALEAMGIIEIKQGEGTFIKEVSPQFPAEIFALTLAAGRDANRELLELRKILEVEAAGLAALRHTAGELQNMEETLRQMETDVLTMDLGQQADWNFHYTVVVASHNSLLVRLMDSISDTMRRGLRDARVELYRSPGTPKRLLEEHYGIFEAIKNGQDKLARQSMYLHLDRVEKALLKQ